MKLSEPVNSALALLDARSRMMAEIALGNDDTLAALAIVLIGAGYDHTRIVRFVHDLMGRDWCMRMETVLSRGEDDRTRPWSSNGDDGYVLARTA